jgi:hypothetical protein
MESVGRASSRESELVTVGKIKRHKEKIYTPLPLVIGVQIEGKEVRYVSMVQGQARNDLALDFRNEYGSENVRA